ncbi:MAG: glycosyltransferase, partial [Vicinamibacterales bacterium]
FVGDGPMRAELESSFPDAIFTGTLPPDGVAVTMASADLFAFPSRTDTAGNVVLEAQASGLPVLVSDEGGPKEYIRPGESGFVCASAGDLCDRAIELCGHRALRVRIGDMARQHALTRSWAAALEPLFQAYRDAVLEPPSRRSQANGVAA